jgi:hypothetical protein
MFAKAHVASTIFCFVFFLYILKIFLFLHHSDYNNYKSLLEQNQERDTKNFFSSKTPYQKRKDVKKDIWISEDNKRTQIHILGNESEIFLQQKFGKIKLVEKIGGLSGWVKEEGKNMRYFTAKNGSFSVPSHQFLAHDINMAIIEKNEPLDFSKVIMSGKANKLTFKLNKKSPRIHAEGFKAKFSVE